MPTSIPSSTSRTKTRWERRAMGVSDGAGEPGRRGVSRSATTLAQYGRLESCERYFWYRQHPNETRELFLSYRVTEQPLTPLLSEKGARHEETITAELGAS